MKIYKLCYFANHYANGGNWTHILEVYDEETHTTVFKLEEDKAIDVKRKVKGFISGNNFFHLANCIKYREDFNCSLLLSDKDVEYLRIDGNMNTYKPRHEEIIN